MIHMPVFFFYSNEMDKRQKTKLLQAKDKRPISHWSILDDTFTVVTFSICYGKLPLVTSAFHL